MLNAFLLFSYRILNSCTDLMKVSTAETKLGRQRLCKTVTSHHWQHQSFSIKSSSNTKTCFSLFQAIRLLVMTSTNLQKEIVESGRVSSPLRSSLRPDTSFVLAWVSGTLEPGSQEVGCSALGSRCRLRKALSIQRRQPRLAKPGPNSQTGGSRVRFVNLCLSKPVRAARRMQKCCQSLDLWLYM